LTRDPITAEAGVAMLAVVITMERREVNFIFAVKMKTGVDIRSS